MNRTFFKCLTLAGLASVVPSVASAQCRTCAQPVPVAVPVAAPMNCTISQTRPVVTTQLRPTQVTTFRDVTETTVQRQQVIENVPVTTHRNVTVDEGGYQMVWVPKPVTKQVSQTTVQQQVKTVDVPVQVTRRVPQLTTQMVPVQSVQLVTQHVPVQTVAFSQPFCNTCAVGTAFGVPLVAPQLGYVTPLYQPAQFTTALIPQPSYAVPQAAALQQPRPSQMTLKPTPDTSRSASAASDDYETVPAREVPMPKDEAAAAPVRKTSMFTGVPSAAAVWQTRNTSIR